MGREHTHFYHGPMRAHSNGTINASHSAGSMCAEIVCGIITCERRGLRILEGERKRERKRENDATAATTTTRYTEKSAVMEASSCVSHAGCVAAAPASAHC
jgi:hypothetical protein